MEPEERDLIKRCQQGHELAFNELFRRYQSKIFSIVYHLIWNRDDVEDVAQNVFSKLYFSIRSYHFQGAFSVWVERVAVNQCFDYLRQKKRHKGAIELDAMSAEEANVTLQPARPGHTPDAEKGVISRQAATRLLKELNENDRALLILKEVDGASVQELSRVFKISESNVKIRLMRARHKLRAIYQKSQERAAPLKRTASGEGRS
ncbi:MAG: sigma-70 family RNA polymerase sigma factor [Acidobacteriia bacterium]|nr:sigma-70 family RNA polymerase sigma factor [Terriglobia bacterium]